MNLTETRREKFEPLFAACLNNLLSTGKYDVRSFERTLREEMKCGHQELRPFMKSLLKIEPYEPLVVFYWEHAGAPEPAMQDKTAICKVYGVKQYGSDEYKAAKLAYWSKHLGSISSEREA